MHLITRDNYSETGEAVRDILLMYTGVVGDRMFLHNADWPIRFDPLKFVDAVQVDSSWYVDVDLLRTGSALAIFAAFYDGWSEEHGVFAFRQTERFAEAIREGRLRHNPDIEAALLEALSGDHASPTDPWFDELSRRLCATHVIAYFRRLVDGTDTGRGPADWV